MPTLSSFGPLINKYLDNATRDLIAIYSSGKYNQRMEREADIVGLHLMALSGYHPKRATEFLSLITKILNNILTTTATMDTKTEDITTSLSLSIPIVILENVNKFFASHPVEEVRIRYLNNLITDVEKIYKDTVTNRRKANLFNLEDYIEDKVETPIETMINVEGTEMIERSRKNFVETSNACKKEYFAARIFAVAVRRATKATQKIVNSGSRAGPRIVSPVSSVGKKKK